MANKQPSWAPDAVATTAGWVNPKTNELLSSVRGLENALPYIRGKIVYPEPVKAAPVPTPAPAKPEVAAVVEEEEKPKKPAK